MSSPTRACVRRILACVFQGRGSANVSGRRTEGTAPEEVQTQHQTGLLSVPAVTLGNSTGFDALPSRGTVCYTCFPFFSMSEFGGDA